MGLLKWPGRLLRGQWFYVFLILSRVIAVGVTPETARDFDTDFLGNHREGISVTAGPFDAKEEYSRRLFRLLF